MYTTGRNRWERFGIGISVLVLKNYKKNLFTSYSRLRLFNFVWATTFYYLPPYHSAYVYRCKGNISRKVYNVFFILLSQAITCRHETVNDLFNLKRNKKCERTIVHTYTIMYRPHII